MRIIKPEKVMMLLFVCAFALAAIDTLVVRGSSLTREEAIEISRNSKLVRSVWGIAGFYTVDASYSNKTQTGGDHGEWSVGWDIHAKNHVGSILVTQRIDAVTGEILSEGALSLR